MLGMRLPVVLDSMRTTKLRNMTAEHTLRKGWVPLFRYNPPRGLGGPEVKQNSEKLVTTGGQWKVKAEEVNIQEGGKLALNIKTRVLGPVPRGSNSADLGGLGICISKLPGDADTTGPGTLSRAGALRNKIVIQKKQIVFSEILLRYNGHSLVSLN